ncbi:MAG: N-acetyl-gamma-glutamyl-phosphate reductase [Phycisphaerales bacterium]|nr:N-acetyl-gamma-glutamyl-phosphate reductase [Phycisphaerales bacterium]
MNKTLHNAAIVGAGGYAGRELVHILLRHPAIGAASLHGSDRTSGATLGALFPEFRSIADLPVHAASVEAIAASRPQVVFLATPVEASLHLAPALLGLRDAPVVVDLSAAFRLKDAEEFSRHYAMAHSAPGLLETAVYGLPELHRSAIAKASLIASPGCYPTSAALPLAPLVRAGAVRRDVRPVIDSTSGISGAGRNPSPRNAFCELSHQPYAVLSHRHQPEIDLYAGVETIFTPHLGPFDRGIVSTIHVELAPGFTEESARRLLEEAYAREPFVRLLPQGAWPSVGAVARTNFCDIALAGDGRGHLVIVSAIDNLLKGAAGQAVQAANIRLGIPETAGLLPHIS